MMLMEIVHLVHLICCGMAGYLCSAFFIDALEGKGPFIAIGNWRNRSVAHRSLQLVNTVAWAAATRRRDRPPYREWHGWEGNAMTIGARLTAARWALEDAWFDLCRKLARWIRP
jgi:hypothetical protein